MEGRVDARSTLLVRALGGGGGCAVMGQCFDSREGLLEAVLQVAASIAAKSPLAVAGTKSVLLHTRWVGPCDGVVGF